jgi:integrase
MAPRYVDVLLTHRRVQLPEKANKADKSNPSHGKTPVRLNQKLVLSLVRGEMWWDDDPKASGFGIRCYPGGGKSFFIDYRIDGRQRRYTIGPFPRWSPDAARQRAKELRKLIDRGSDPAGDKRERREAPTVQDLVDRYVKDWLPRRAGGPGRMADEKRMLAEIVAHLGKHTKIADVHGGDIAEMHEKISQSLGRSGNPRRVRANRILTVASKMFSLALIPRAGETLAWRNALLGNPCKGIERNHEEGRERFFSQKELAAISEALAEYDGVAADCARLIMLTGCRPAEAMKSMWAEFDAEAGYWIKPSAHTKQRRVHKLPLSPAAMELVADLRERRRSLEWVFPGDRPGQHIAAMWHLWYFVRKRAGLGPDARLYDLRHTFASVGAGGGLSLPIIGRLLGHTQVRTTQRYAHLADDPLREAAAKITTVIANAGKAGAEVIVLKRDAT